MYVEHLRIPVGVGALHAERVGRGGPPVLLLHGFGTCAFLWRQLAPQLASAGYTAIALDLLGHGESDRPSDAAFTLDAQAEHVIRAVAALRLPDMAVIGQDIGAGGARVAASPRSRVTSLALLSPPDPDELPESMSAMQQNAALLALSSNTLPGALPLWLPCCGGRRGSVPHARTTDRAVSGTVVGPMASISSCSALQPSNGRHRRDRLRAVAVPVLS
jgi:pimeloyl-ACP methyl ester carboxylesterase